jgi:hypothetical protein
MVIINIFSGVKQSIGGRKIGKSYILARKRISRVTSAGFSRPARSSIAARIWPAVLQPGKEFYGIFRDASRNVIELFQRVCKLPALEMNNRRGANRGENNFINTLSTLSPLILRARFCSCVQNNYSRMLIQ